MEEEERQHLFIYMAFQCPLNSFSSLSVFISFPVSWNHVLTGKFTSNMVQMREKYQYHPLSFTLAVLCAHLHFSIYYLIAGILTSSHLLLHHPSGIKRCQSQISNTGPFDSLLELLFWSNVIMTITLNY